MLLRMLLTKAMPIIFEFKTFKITEIHKFFLDDRKLASRKKKILNYDEHNYLI